MACAWLSDWPEMPIAHVRRARVLAEARLPSSRAALCAYIPRIHANHQVKRLSVDTCRGSSQRTFSCLAVMFAISRRYPQGDGASASGGSASGGIVATDDNRNPILQAVTWLLLAVGSLVICCRAFTKLYIKARTPFVMEDALVLSAFVVFVGESLVMLVPASTIFGKSSALISAGELRNGLKIGYARDLLFLLSLGLSKLAVSESLGALSPDKKHRYWTLTLRIGIILWTATSFLTTAFQCGTQGPWNTPASGCINKSAFLDYVGVTSLLTELGLVVLPIVIIYPLQMALRLRLIILTFFSMRLCVSAATICQLVYQPRLSDPDYTLRAFPYWLSAQLALFASMTTACIIYFLPFLRSVQSGLLSANPQGLTPHLTLTSLSKAHLMKKSTNASSSSAAAAAASDRSGGGGGGTTWPRTRRDYIQIRTDVAVIRGGKAHVQKHESGMGSRNAQTDNYISSQATTFGSV
ncbi:hypothetical protein GGR56DRAFT_646137 [Xylariaceae sp. FL0804]|nr:hypothetical protein GGR56DRAFT_646137 [Xylariaceae sp. FL0804]